MMVDVHGGKGAKDRFVPLPQNTLDLLRRYWVSHKNPNLLNLRLCGRGYLRHILWKTGILIYKLSKNRRIRLKSHRNYCDIC